MTNGIISASYGTAPQIQDTQVTKQFQPCSVGTRNAGGALQIEGGGRTENVGITGFNLWNRILTESEIVEEANTYDRGMRHGWSHCEVEGVVQEATQEEFF